MRGCQCVLPTTAMNITWQHTKPFFNVTLHARTSGTRLTDLDIKNDACSQAPPLQSIWKSPPMLLRPLTSFNNGAIRSDIWHHVSYFVSRETYGNGRHHRPLSSLSHPTLEPLPVGASLRGDSGRVYTVSKILADRRKPLLCVYQARYVPQS
jgi:hypothetical protein